MPDDIIELNLGKLLGAEEKPSIQQLTLYISHSDKDSKVVKNIHKWIKEAQKLLTIIGGGATALPPADGTWLKRDIDTIVKLKDADIVWEKTTIMYTYIYSDRFIKNLKSLREFLHRFGRETNQGEVIFVFVGSLYRIRKFDHIK